MKFKTNSSDGMNVFCLFVCFLEILDFDFQNLRKKALNDTIILLNDQKGA